MSPSFTKLLSCAIVESFLLFFGVAQVAGFLACIRDGDMDASVWVSGAIGALCLTAIVPLFGWSIRR